MARGLLILLFLVTIGGGICYTYDDAPPRSTKRFCELDDICGFQQYDGTFVRECHCIEGESCIKVPPLYRLGVMVEVNWRYCVHPQEYFNKYYPNEKQRRVGYVKSKRGAPQTTAKPTLAPKRKRMRKKKGWVSHRVHY